MQSIFRITGKVQHYAWGGKQFLPSLLHHGNTKNLPFAEYWLGTHPLAPTVVTESGRTLTDYIYPKKIPYLLKILDVKDMLSIQVHPTKTAAEEEFLKENKAGIPLSAPHRNYKDDNHKPELVVALGEFYLLHGFKEKSVLKETLSSIPELNFLLKDFDEGDYKKLYTRVMTMPNEEVMTHLEPLLNRIVPLYKKNKLKKNTVDFWAARAAETYNQPGKTDRGIFSVYLFNLVQLTAGEGVFQDAGVPHAYLEGQNVEIMSNSDNVLRGGLTSKHIDVPELLKHVKFEGIKPVISKPVEKNNELTYETPVDDLRLSSFKLKNGESAVFSTENIDILLQIEGKSSVKSGMDEINLSSGEALAANAGVNVSIHALSDSLVFRATSGA